MSPGRYADVLAGIGDEIDEQLAAAATARDQAQWQAAQAAADLDQAQLEVAVLTARLRATAGGPGTYRPGPDTTGPIPGVPLTRVTGSLVTTRDGEILTNLDIAGKLTIKHRDVTVVNCIVRGGTPVGSNHVAVQAWPPAARTRLIDVRVDPTVRTAAMTACIQGGSLAMVRCDLTGAVDGARVHGGGVELLGCWIHDLPWHSDDPAHTDGTHNDGVQIEGGDGYRVVGCAVDMGPQSNAAVMITQNTGNTTNCVIDRCWLSTTPGGAAAGLNAAETKQLGPIGLTLKDSVWSVPAAWRTGKPCLIPAKTLDAATITGCTHTDGTPLHVTRVN